MMSIMKFGHVVVPLVVMWPLCPESHHEPATHEHVPHEDHRPAPTRAIIGFDMGSSSAAGTPPASPR
jgi:hypothetical protein